jgi:polyferredoxin
MSNAEASKPRLRLPRANPDGSPWIARALRITNWRVLSQAFFFALFVFLVWTTWFSRLGGYPVSLFLEIDPLVTLATAISTHTVYRWLWRALWVLIPTLLLGRIFCGWICPYGTLHNFVGWLFNIRKTRDNIDKNRYRPLFQLKYYILVVMLALAVFGALQIGLLDPLCLLTRSMAVAVAPALDAALPSSLSFLTSAPGAPEQRIFDGAWVVGVILVGLVGMNLVIPRFFCRVLCPLGALLGWLSRFALWRIDRDLTRCTDCDLCLQRCEGASDPQAALRKSECFVCFNCIDDCPEDALSFKLAPLPVAQRIAGDPKRGSATLDLQVARDRDQGAGRAPAALGPRRAGRGRDLPLPPLFQGGQRARVRRQGDPAARHRGRARVSRALHQVRPVHQRLPDQRAAARGAGSGRVRGTVDAGDGFCRRLLPAQLHAVQRGLPHRGDPEDLARAETGHRQVRRAGADPAGHRVFQPRALSALGDGDPLRGLRGGLPGDPQGDRDP